MAHKLDPVDGQRGCKEDVAKQYRGTHAHGTPVVELHGGDLVFEEVHAHHHQTGDVEHVEHQLGPCFAQSQARHAIEHRSHGENSGYGGDPTSKIFDFSLNLTFITLHSFFNRSVFKPEQHGIDAEKHKGDDGIARAPRHQRGGAAIGQEFFGEWQFEQDVYYKIDRQSPEQTRDHKQWLARILKTHSMIVQESAAHEADQQPHSGEIIRGLAVEEAGNSADQQDSVPNKCVLHPLLKQLYDHHTDQAQKPPRQHVRGIVRANHKPRNAREQRNHNGKHSHPPFAQIAPQGAEHGRRVGRMPAGKGIALRRDVVDVRVRFYDAQDPDALVVEVWSAPQGNVLKHGVPGQAHNGTHAHRPAQLLVIAPVYETDNQNQHQFLSKRGEEGQNRNPRAADAGLEPFHQAHFPGKEKSVAGCCHHIRAPLSITLFCPRTASP